jgi:hypothetical protein
MTKSELIKALEGASDDVKVMIALEYPGTQDWEGGQTAFYVIDFVSVSTLNEIPTLIYIHD